MWQQLVLLGVFNLLFLGLNLRFLYYYVLQNELKYNQGLFCFITTILIIQLLIYWTFLIPLNVFLIEEFVFDESAAYWDIPTLTTYITIILVNPLILGYYGSDNDYRITKVRPWVQAIKKFILPFIIMALFSSIFYFINRRTTVEVCSEIEPITCAQKTVNMSFSLLIISLITFVGSFFSLFVLTTGITHCMIDSLSKIIYYPKKYPENKYNECKKILKERANALVKAGDRLIKKSQKMDSVGFTSRYRKEYNLKIKVEYYKKSIVMIEEEFAELESHKNDTYYPFYYVLYIFKLIPMALNFIIWLTVNIAMISKQMKLNILDFFLFNNSTKGYTVMNLILVSSFSCVNIYCLFVGLNKIASFRFFKLLLNILQPKKTSLNTLLIHSSINLIIAVAMTYTLPFFFPLYTQVLKMSEFSMMMIKSSKILNFFIHTGLLSVLYILMYVILTLIKIWKNLLHGPVPLNNSKRINQWNKLLTKLGLNKTEEGWIEPVSEDEDSEEVKKSRLTAKLKQIDNDIVSAPKKIFTLINPMK